MESRIQLSLGLLYLQSLKGRYQPTLHSRSVALTRDGVVVSSAAITENSDVAPRRIGTILWQTGCAYLVSKHLPIPQSTQLHVQFVADLLCHSRVPCS